MECKPLVLTVFKKKRESSTTVWYCCHGRSKLPSCLREGLLTRCDECFKRLRPLVWEDQRLIPGAWQATTLEPTMCSLALLNASRWEGCANPDSLILLFMHLALHHPFQFAGCMLTAGPGPGLTNSTQISASHLPRGASLELILASAGPEWCSTVHDFTTCACVGVWVVRICSGRECAAHQFSDASRVSENTGTSFVSLEGNNQSAGCHYHFVKQNSQ